MKLLENKLVFKSVLLVSLWTTLCSGQASEFDVDVHQTPALGSKGTSTKTMCYDQFNRPQRCIPEFENAAYNRFMDSTNTCGEERPQEYCVQTGAWTGPSGFKKSCETCYSGDHHPRYLSDAHNENSITWWQSETLLEGVQQVNLTLKFGKAFDITYIRLWFYSPRPESFYISKKTTDDGPWIPYQYYSASCAKTYGLPDQGALPRGDEDRAMCTSEYSDISPLRGGNVAFGTLYGRPSAFNFDASEELQEWVTATEIMITLDRQNTFGDEVFGDPQVLKSYFYAIGDVAVGARCKCNGHASECVQSTGPGGYRRVCKCEHNTAGPDCGECLPFYNDVPWARANVQDAHECKQCNCNGFSNRCMFDAKLYEQTGHGGHCLDCTANRDGSNCERCKPNYYMREDGYCTACECDEVGSRNLQCNGEGKCQCKPGVTGDKCDRCAPNYYDFGSSGCKTCACNEAGSLYNQPACDPNSGVCYCKENVEGKQCHECKPGFFNMDYSNEFGCTPCFCYGHSSECSSASGYTKYAVESTFAKSSERWRAETQDSHPIELKYERISQSIGVRAVDESSVYFVAPDRFLGDQRASYNQLLEFNLRIGDGRSGASAMDIILEGNGHTVTNAIFQQNNKHPTMHPQQYKFRLHEHPDFGWQPKLDSRTFISILTNLTAIKIRGTYSPQGTGFLDDVKLETASRGTAGQPALWMEFCECPDGYVGQFCESCAPGFRHSPAHGGPFTSCIPCDCNNHASICDSETGRCICEHNTYGENCDLCARGYYGNALQGTPDDCLSCNCPNNGPCIQIDGDIIICTECPTGYSGHRCDVCSDGFYGDPTGRFGPATPCQECDCSDNIDPNAIGNCNTTTGECLRCIHNTGGEKCEVCLPGFYGNALVLPKGDCKRCECYPVGTKWDEQGEPICDSNGGSCMCKPHVIGRNCDQCEDGFYNLQSNEGCQTCNCDPIGSYNATCNLYTGQCYCRPGVTGLRCDHCEARKYGFSLEGCKDCDCDPVGSKDTQCDPSGQCPCLDNVEGRRCDRCKENKYDRHRGCVDCPDCYNLVQHAYRSHNDKLAKLREILDEIERRPTVIPDEEFPKELGKLENDIEDFYEEIKEATGENSIIGQVQDIDERSKDITRTISAIDENIEVIRKKMEETESHKTNSDQTLVDIEFALRDFEEISEPEFKKALEKAWNSSNLAGQQSDKMTKIAQEARELADALDAKAKEISDTSKDAKTKSIGAYNKVKEANSKQAHVNEESRGLKKELVDSENKLGQTKEWTSQVADQAAKAKDHALALLNEVQNIMVPQLNIPEMRTKSNKLREEAERLKKKTDDLFTNSEDLRKSVDDKNAAGKDLLIRSEEQQNETGELLVEIYDLNNTAQNALDSWIKILNETESIYKDLQDFDSETQKSKEEAEEALKTIANIEEIIEDTLEKTTDAQVRLAEAAKLANSALQRAQEAKELEKEAEDIVSDVKNQAEDLNNDADGLTAEINDIQGRVDNAEAKLDGLLDMTTSNNSLVVQAKDKVGKAGKDTEKVSKNVNELISSVQEILDELKSTPDIKDEDLDQLEARLVELEEKLKDAKLEEKLSDLQKKHKDQSDLIELYKSEITKMEADVNNIKDIVDALPDGCFKGDPHLEP